MLHRFVCWYVKCAERYLFANPVTNSILHTYLTHLLEDFDGVEDSVALYNTHYLLQQNIYSI